MFSVTEGCIYNPGNGVIRSIKAKYRSLIIQQIINRIDVSISIPKVNILDVMLTVRWEDVIIKGCLAFDLKTKPTQKNDVDVPFIELRRNMKSLGVDEISEELTLE